jgi:hypothetical protein
MKELEAHAASGKLAQLASEFRVNVLVDWGPGDGGAWQEGSWSLQDLDLLHDTIVLLANAIGGKDRLVQHLDGVTVKKSDIGSHAGEAVAHQVSFGKDARISAWTIVHEFAHAWDASKEWKISRALEKYTGGFTSPFLSRLKRIIGQWDAGPKGRESGSGRQGRRPGCNHAGYFYGDKPSGSNWLFDRREDFAESVAMYVGWERNNALSDHALKKIVRFSKYRNDEKDDFGVVDKWADYARYFHPDGGDYRRTKRWKFIDDLVSGKVQIE